MHISPLAIKRAIAQQGGLYVLDDLVAAPNSSWRQVYVKSMHTRDRCSFAL